MDHGGDLLELLFIGNDTVPVVDDGICLADIVSPRNVPSHLIIGFPFTFNHVPEFICFVVLPVVKNVFVSDAVMILRNVVYYSRIIHAFENGTAADGAPTRAQISVME